jgi:hypothetical protein
MLDLVDRYSVPREHATRDLNGTFSNSNSGVKGEVVVGLVPLQLLFLTNKAPDCDRCYRCSRFAHPVSAPSQHLRNTSLLSRETQGH